MKSTLFLLFFISLNLVCYSQSEIDELGIYITENQNITELKKIKNIRLNSFNIIASNVEIERDIDFGYKHLRIAIIPSPGEDYLINIIYKNDSIIIVNVAERKIYDRSILKSKYIIYDTNFFSEYIIKHNNFYDSKQTIKDFEEFILSENIVGFGCGIVGTDISYASKKTEKYIKKKDVVGLNNLLTSICPELQVLGAIGLIKVNKISSKQIKIIKYLTNRNSVIFSCAGCVYNFGETFSDRLSIETN
jgi:hypothetical protein